MGDIALLKPRHDSSPPGECCRLEGLTEESADHNAEIPRKQRTGLLAWSNSIKKMRKLTVKQIVNLISASLQV